MLLYWTDIAPNRLGFLADRPEFFLFLEDCGVMDGGKSATN